MKLFKLFSIIALIGASAVPALAQCSGAGCTWTSVGTSKDYSGSQSGSYQSGSYQASASADTRLPGLGPNEYLCPTTCPTSVDVPEGGRVLDCYNVCKKEVAAPVYAPTYSPTPQPVYQAYAPVARPVIRQIVRPVIYVPTPVPMPVPTYVNGSMAMYPSQFYLQSPAQSPGQSPGQSYAQHQPRSVTIRVSDMNVGRKSSASMPAHVMTMPSLSAFDRTGATTSPYCVSAQPVCRH